MESVIAIPVWDHEHQLQFTEAVVHQICEESEGDFVLVVINNASPNVKTAQFLEGAVKHFTNLKVITNEENIGYGPAINQAWEWGYSNGAKFFIGMNNDIVFTDSRWLETAFLDTLKKFKWQLVGAREITFNSATIFEIGYPPEPYLEGWAVAVARCFIEEVGTFHPDIKLWFEDVELSIRARRCGYETNESPVFSWRNDRGAPLRGPFYHLYGQTGFKLGMGWPNPIAVVGRQVIVRDHFS